jgi:hypothetical protein
MPRGYPLALVIMGTLGSVALLACYCFILLGVIHHDTRPRDIRERDYTSRHAKYEGTFSAITSSWIFLNFIGCVGVLLANAFLTDSTADLFLDICACSL